MEVTVKSNVYNNKVSVIGRNCQAEINVVDNTTVVKQVIISGGAKGAPGLGADPEFILSTEQRLAELEGDPKHEWNATQW